MTAATHGCTMHIHAAPWFAGHCSQLDPPRSSVKPSDFEVEQYVGKHALKVQLIAISSDMDISPISPAVLQEVNNPEIRHLKSSSFETEQCIGHLKQNAQLSQRDRAAGCVSFGQKWKTETGRQYFTDIIDLSSTTMP